MRFDEATTHVARAPREDVRWVTPPLILGRAALAAVTATAGTAAATTGNGHGLAGGFRLGEHLVAEARGHDGACELYVVAHAERGSLHIARVLRREHAALAPELLAAAREVQSHPHRNLLTVLETGWTDEATPRAFVVHERIVGRSLTSLLAGRGGVEWPLVLAIGLQCAQALEALHRMGLAHTELRPDSAALVHVAGDQFRVVLGGLDHAQAIKPGACAAEEPRVRDDLFALGDLLSALTATSVASGSRPPEMLACMLARMIDPRPAIRPASASELHDQLAAVHEHIDPDLSGMRMLGEALRKISSDDFEVEVEVEADEPPPPVRVSPSRPSSPPPQPPQPRGRARWPALLLVGLTCFVGGYTLREVQVVRPPAPRVLQVGDDEAPSLMQSALRRVPEQHGPALPTTILPRGDSPVRPSRTLAARVIPPPVEASPETPVEPPPEPAPAAEVAEEVEVVEAAPDELPTDFLPIPTRRVALDAPDVAGAS